LWSRWSRDVNLEGLQMPQWVIIPVILAGGALWLWLVTRTGGG
jgi:hypothetical protein